jgi:glycosyltransferase involved in cell wall biosynthesis
MDVVTDAPAAPGPGTDLREVASGLHVRLDSPLPAELGVGAGNALFVCGSCFHEGSEVQTVQFVVGEDLQPLMAHGMPRLDVFRAVHPALDPAETKGLDADPDSDGDPRFRSYLSGFWGILELGARESDGVVNVGLRATLDGGASVDAGLGTIVLRRGREVRPSRREGAAGNGLVAICMATYNPPAELFERQIESIRQQTHRDWVCLISDDGSTEDHLGSMQRTIGDDSRFVISRSSERVGFYANFERALGMAPADAAYVAMADQDDRWDPDKLEVLLEAIGDSGLVYSDARVVDRQGALISDTYWSTRRNNYTDLKSLLIANTVSGAASLFRREVLDLALPFPPQHGKPYHDHWVGCVALASGRIAYVDRPLYDYVQHREAALGHARANVRERSRENPMARLRRIAGDPRSVIARWRTTYFWDVCRIVLFATVLLQRCENRMSTRKRRAVRRVIEGERSFLAIPWLLIRRTRSLMGRNETLGVETGLLRGIAWRQAVARLSGTSGRPGRRFRFSASLPPRSSLSTGPRITHPGTRTLAEKTRPLELRIRPEAPARVNLLIPTIDLSHFFGGYIAKLNLARRLAERGRRVRLVTVDETPPLPPSWRRTISSYEGLEGVFDRVEVAFAREDPALEVSPSDQFIATTWWTAHLAHTAAGALGAERFTYLIQECEPFSFPMGAFAALARQSYEFAHFAAFSTEFLREYFRRHSLGVYADGPEAGDRHSVAFENAITPIDPPTEAELAARSSRRLLLYARPEQHAARNMFELAILALARAVADDAIGVEWELHGVGATGQNEPPVDVGEGRAVELLPRRSQGDYADLLHEHDVGLALMYTPHPSLVPIEMASAGMLTVTNSFENKTPGAMSAVSSNLITVPPTVDGLVGGLREAVAGVGDSRRRVEGSQARWSRDWDRSFDHELMGRIEGFLESC